jgi:hypothetical protein
MHSSERRPSKVRPPLYPYTLFALGDQTKLKAHTFVSNNTKTAPTNMPETIHFNKLFVEGQVQKWSWRQQFTKIWASLCRVDALDLDSSMIMTTRGEIATMLAKVVVVGVRCIVARGARDLTNYWILYFS